MSEVVLSGLARKRFELVRALAECEAEAAALKQAILHLDAVTALYTGEKVLQPLPRGRRSKRTRGVLEFIRTSVTPPMPRQIAEHIAAMEGKSGDGEAAQRLLKRVEVILYDLRRRGWLETVDIGQRAMGWRVALGKGREAL